MIINTKKAVKVCMAILLSAAILLSCALLLTKAGRSTDNIDRVKFIFFDVGQGDASLIETQAGCCLIDAGPEASQQSLCTALKAHGVSEIAFFFLTHTDTDHAGGADEILEKFRVSTLYLPLLSDESENINSVKRAARAAGTDIKYVSRGDRFNLGNAEICVLSPETLPSGDENSDSLVLLVSFGKTNALYMADADTSCESRLLETYGEGLLCDILKVGHHGSDTSSSEDFLEAVKPQYAVISCGLANSYGHPHPKVLKRLQNCAAEILRTDLLGEIRLESDGLTVKQTAK